LETSIPIATPIVKESQVGSLLKMFWFVLAFMIIAFANPKAAEAALKGELSDKGVRFLVKARLNDRLPYGLMVVV
jgi:hypothetical protein